MPASDPKAEKYARYRRWWGGLSQSERVSYKNRNAPEPQPRWAWPSDEAIERMHQQLIDNPERGRARLRHLRGFA